MHIRSAELETVCGITSKLPENNQVEFAFAGKSNVGKSSLINAMVNRKALARTSSQPGKTQTINFYHLNEAFYFVDLPGYGYARVSQELKAKWGKMIERYLMKSKQLKLVFLLVDIRHEPSENDKDMYDWIVYQGFRPVVVATKLDKINRSQRDKQKKLIRLSLGMKASDPLILFSSETKEGAEELWKMMETELEAAGVFSARRSDEISKQPPGEAVPDSAMKPVADETKTPKPVEKQADTGKSAAGKHSTGKSGKGKSGMGRPVSGRAATGKSGMEKSRAGKINAGKPGRRETGASGNPEEKKKSVRHTEQKRRQ